MSFVEEFSHEAEQFCIIQLYCTYITEGRFPYNVLLACQLQIIYSNDSECYKSMFLKRTLISSVAEGSSLILLLCFVISNSTKCHAANYKQLKTNNINWLVSREITIAS